MKTYIAQLETASGSQQIQLAAANIQDAQSQLEVRSQSVVDAPVRYTIQEQVPAQLPDTTAAFLNASGGLLACIFVLVVAEYKIRRYFKG
jgi:hypothetical protein